MKVGCFAVVEPFLPFEQQLARIAALGFKYADVTDNHEGGSLGVEFGFSPSVGLDANPFDIRRAFEHAGLTPTTWCAHANLLDPSAPWRYGTAQILKAIRNAAAIGIPYVITTEGDPKTAFGHRLTERERVFTDRRAAVRTAASGRGPGDHHPVGAPWSGDRFDRGNGGHPAGMRPATSSGSEP